MDSSKLLEYSLGQLGQLPSQLQAHHLALQHELALLCTTHPEHPATTILAHRNTARAILDQLSTFENLVEAPQLIATAISNQLPSQAILLARKLSQLPTHTPLIQTINAAVSRSLQALRDQSLSSLSQPSLLSLPTALPTINILRSLSTPFQHPPNHHQITVQPISEPELRLAFLTARWQALADNLRQLSPPPPPPPPPPPTTAATSQPDEEHLKFLRRSLELWRAFVGDSLSIYHHIFLDPLRCPTPPSHHPSPHSLDDPQSSLNCFLTQALDLQSSLLQTHLGSILSVSSLNSLLTQLAYCAAAFAKWGFDFTLAVCPLIVSRLEELISARIHLGLRQLSLDLKPLISPTPTGAAAHPLNRNGGLQLRRRSLNPFPSSTHPTFVGLEHSLLSPDALSRLLKLKPAQLDLPRAESFATDWLSLFPPLVRFVNSQLTALNELRLLPVAGSYAPIAQAQLDALCAATDELRSLAHILPACPQPEEHEPEEGEETGDEEKRSACRLRRVTHRLLLLWTRNILPALERALRVGIYQQLEIHSPQPRFLDLLDQAERLLAQILPTHHPQKKSDAATPTEKPAAETHPPHHLEDQRQLKDIEHAPAAQPPQDDKPSTPQETTPTPPQDPTDAVKPTNPLEKPAADHHLEDQKQIDHNDIGHAPAAQPPQDDKPSTPQETTPTPPHDPKDAVKPTDPLEKPAADHHLEDQKQLDPKDPEHPPAAQPPQDDKPSTPQEITPTPQDLTNVNSLVTPGPNKHTPQHLDLQATSDQPSPDRTSPTAQLVADDSISSS
ncbi:hypothetical protein PtA15_12A582 [Puccinia triticina]|uniref:Conserved oligomeric Golgi complex subunit 8 n=1 Tax=Puccinia triticina TaxID=208348 RepID=A0ABY7D1M1_9BASI|nr:uncharacterized protein PtA15_12A582 [Puccinia triticina]WAQ90592.1 hypothetical protein PtA15_12A582 [Puccinia triticina]